MTKCLHMVTKDMDTVSKFSVIGKNPDLKLDGNIQ